MILSILAQLDSTEVDIPKTELSQGSVADVLSIVLSTAAAVAVIIILIGSMRYVISRGDPQNTAKAKNTILYALIGLLVCVVAFSAVRFLMVRV